jgi:DNA-directed RNA polymerase specialized sigma24 family protein
MMNTQCNTTTIHSDASLHASPQTYQWQAKSNRAESSRWRRRAANGWINVAEFDQLLGWLGPDAETAGRKYEDIRGRLIVMFRSRRCVFAEDLADATFERVAQKLAYLTDSFIGDPALYIYGVAKKIYLEYQRKIRIAPSNSDFVYQPSADNENLENMLLRLDEALSAIPKSDRELILSYYSGSKQDKIVQRKALARQFGLGPNALRLRVFRIRREIKNYMLQSNSNCSVLLT